MNAEHDHCHSCAHEHKFDANEVRKDFLNSLVFTIPLWLMMLGLHLPIWVQVICASVVQFWGGRNFYKASYHSAMMGQANMDLLVALGTTAAYAYSLFVVILKVDQPLYFESSATIITLVLLGRWMEARSQTKASEAVQRLLELQPKSAKVLRNGEFVETPIKDIHLDDIFLVRPGENIPVDGVLVEGHSTVNEAMLTGESQTLEKKKDSNVFAGTNNLNGSFKAKATKVGADTALSGIVKLVEEAQNSRAPVQRLADKVSEYFVPIIIVVALLTFLTWWMHSGVISTALINAVSVLIVACPCALGLATPTVITVASGLAAKMAYYLKKLPLSKKPKKFRP